MTVTQSDTAPVPATAPVTGSTAGQLRRRVRSQAAPLTLVFATLLYVFPSEIVLAGPLNSNGAPVRLVGMGALLLLALDLLRTRTDRTARADMTVVLVLLYLVQALFFYGWTGLDITDDGASSLRKLLFSASACGMALYTAVRVRDLVTVHKVIGLVVAGCVLNAGVGILQALGVKILWWEVVKLPGMTSAGGVAGLGERNGLTRVFGTTSHPIEFAVSLACCLPLAIHLAMHARTQRARRLALAAAMIMGLALPFALSRGGLISIALSVGVFLVVQSWQTRLVTTLTAAFAVVMAYVLVPSTYQAISSLFVDTADDPSITGRLDDYPIVDAAFNAAPWLGGAPVPEGLILDNQWLATLVQFGLVGAGALALLVVLPVLDMLVTARKVRGTDPVRRSLAAAIAGALVAVAFSGTVFDLLAFGQAAMLMFVLVGLSAAVSVRATTGGRAPRL